MDNKTPDEKDKKVKKSSLWELFSPLLSPKDSAIMMVYYGGCMGAIVFVTFLIRWLVGIFKGF
jgi:hypothetical protein